MLIFDRNMQVISSKVSFLIVIKICVQPKNNENQQVFKINLIFFIKKVITPLIYITVNIEYWGI